MVVLFEPLGIRDQQLGIYRVWVLLMEIHRNLRSDQYLHISEAKVKSPTLPLSKLAEYRPSITTLCRENLFIMPSSCCALPPLSRSVYQYLLEITSLARCWV